MKLSTNILTQALCLVGTLSHTAFAAGEFRDDVHVLMYETDGKSEGQPNSPLHFFKERSQVAKLKTTVYGNYLEHRGFGDKYQTLRPLLEIIDEETLIILSDARDVALNIPEDEDMAVAAVDHFIENFKRITETSPNAVVVSAEAQCCVSAMSHAHPSEYFDPVTGERNKRACSSGMDDCRWSENKNIYSWVTFMHQRRFNATGMEGHGDVYLNAGLIAGYPKDLIKLLDTMDIEPYEDDQAILTGLMYRYPEMIVLDYGQEMFGNSQWPQGPEDGCVFEGHGSQSPLIHLETQTQPLLIHTPGKLYACLDLIIEALGGRSQHRYHPTTRKLMTGRLSLAAQLGFGGASGAISIEDKIDGEESVVEEDAEVEAEEGDVEEEIVKEEIVEEVEEKNLGGIEPDEVEPANYGYGATNYGRYGNDGYDVTNYGNYGYGSTNYGQYGSYGQ
mmetsp:Transcript_7424/g.15948  ORF Transcript_7424/g.15948 Transcript_7424/m.15948 type:complete len:447 (+) Transcript_7424:61-1401(+)